MSTRPWKTARLSQQPTCRQARRSTESITKLCATMHHQVVIPKADPEGQSLYSYLRERGLIRPIFMYNEATVTEAEYDIQVSVPLLTRHCVPFFHRQHPQSGVSFDFAAYLSSIPALCVLLVSSPYTTT
eukprot:scaffold132489_cov16-Prasinocladus_malaysianus.AAC.1